LPPKLFGGRDERARERVGVSIRFTGLKYVQGCQEERMALELDHSCAAVWIAPADAKSSRFQP
jgi:hypothetical protein